MAPESAGDGLTRSSFVLVVSSFVQAGVISLQKLLVREKAGGSDTRSIYLISSNPDEPEMYELQCQNPREKKIWIDTIRSVAPPVARSSAKSRSTGSSRTSTGSSRANHLP